VARWRVEGRIYVGDIYHAQLAPVSACGPRIPVAATTTSRRVALPLQRSAMEALSVTEIEISGAEEETARWITEESADGGSSLLRIIIQFLFCSTVKRVLLSLPG
jgi:hypothetical protein